MKSTTKRKTSVTLSPDVVKTLDRLAGKDGNRSAVVEQAILALWEAKLKARREASDRAILAAHADRLNEEAEDAMSYQVGV